MNKKFHIRALALVVMSTWLVGFASAQMDDDQGDPGKPAAGSPPPAGGGLQRGKSQKKPGDLRDYKEVITADAKTQTGMIKVHQIEDKVLWEIPVSLMGRDLLWQVELSEISGSMSDDYSGEALDAKVIRFTRRGNKIFVKLPSYDMRAVKGSGMEAGVNAANVDPITAVFDIMTEGPEKAPVIDVTSLFLMGAGDLGVAGHIGAAGVDPSRSYIDRINDFPQNVETRTQLTLMSGGGRFAALFGGGGGGRSSTVTVDTSLALLPEKPMMGRYSDSRVGYFSTPFSLYGTPKNREEERAFIERYRLEKKDPTADVSEPTHQIVFYIGREVPAKWRPYMKNAILAWNDAFLQAGFKNVMVAKDAPTKEEDPTWNPEDARYNVIRWEPSPVENAMGPHVVDPRSGEVISAHVIVWHNVLALVQDWYFAQASATDPKAHRLPLPDDLTGELLQYVVTHEVGHTLGLAHNFRASNAYTIANLRDPKFVKENGVSASIMDYARFNYVAQPGDNAPTIGKLGPYDKFAIEWGYKPLTANIPEEEKGPLDDIASRQVTHKELRWAGDISGFLGIDPQSQTEDLSDDPIEATRLGGENIKRIAKNLIPATTKFGDDYTDLREQYFNLWTQRLTELMHVSTMIGGVEEQDYHAGRGGSVYLPVSGDKQRKAAQFLVQSLATPPELMNPEVLSRIRPEGALNFGRAVQTILISEMLSGPKLTRMAENQVLSPATAYTPAQLLSDVTNGVWSKVYSPKPSANYFEKDAENTYLDILDTKINGSAAQPGFQSVAELQLKSLALKLDKAIAKTSDPATKQDFVDSRKKISKILDGKSKAAFQAASFYDGLSSYVQTQSNPTASADFSWPLRPLLKEWVANPQAFVKKVTDFKGRQ